MQQEQEGWQIRYMQRCRSWVFFVGLPWSIQPRQKPRARLLLFSDFFFVRFAPVSKSIAGLLHYYNVNSMSIQLFFFWTFVLVSYIPLP
jgi:hypothetical protein